MSLVTVNGIEAPIATDSARLGDRIVGGDVTADDGSLHRARSVYMDTLSATTRLLSPTDALAWRGLLEGRGHRLSCDVDPDYTGTDPSAGADQYTSRGVLLVGTASRRGGYAHTGVIPALSTVALGTDSYFDQAIAAEEGRTNLFPANVRRGTDASSNTTGFQTAGGGTLASSTTYAFEGLRSVSFQSTSAGLHTVETSAAGLATVTGSADYVVSFYARVASSTLVVDVEVYDNDGGATTVSLTFTSTWQRFEIVHTAEPSATTAGIRWTPAATGTIYLDAIQIEAGTFATSWVGAGALSTDVRSAGGISNQLTDVRRQDDLTVMGWFYGPQWDLKTNARYASDATLWSLGESTEGVSLRHNGSTGALDLRIASSLAAEATAVSYATGIGNKAWHHVAVVLRRAPTTGVYKATLFVDGASVGTPTDTYAIPSWGPAPTLYLGRRFGGSGYFNGIVDELVVLPFALTAAMISTTYNARFSDLPRLNVAGDYFGETIEALGKVTGDGLRYTAAQDPTAGFQHRNAVIAFTLAQALR
jgi:hypothetical protein